MLITGITVRRSASSTASSYDSTFWIWTVLAVRKKELANLITCQFAIRVNIRNNTIISRQNIIRQVAARVGTNHHVDLSDFDLLILVEIYKVRAVIRVINCNQTSELFWPLDTDHDNEANL
jgi:tRNA(Ser,Leu) C12 N-acetylase TAN1